MRRGHGHGAADRSIFEPQDAVALKRLDEIIANGGEDADGVRLATANRFLGPGRFGKLFPDLDAFRPPDEALEELGRAMSEVRTDDREGDIADVPSGYTYFGQFVDHDLSFDKTQDFPEIDDPEEIEQARTPTLELDSLYGLGPVHHEELYDPDSPKGKARFRIGLTSPVPSSGGVGLPDVPVSLPNDLPRGPDKLAVIGDERNDENLVVAQTHLAFLKFHNRVLETQPAKPQDGPGSPFERARRTVRWHYQWVVLNDFLPRLVDPSVLADVRAGGRRFYRFDRAPFNGSPYMPIEFSVAAYRLGHSMIRESYNFNRVFGKVPNALADGTLELLFAFTGKGGFTPAGDHPTLPSNWIIDWRRFFEVGDPALLNFARRLDPSLAPVLQALPGMPARVQSLAVRNLLRGSRLGLPTGQDVANAVGVTPLTPTEVAAGPHEAVLRRHGLHERTPLWYYVLKEAEVQNGGRRLGQVGSRIVAEVFVGLVEGDRRSFLSEGRGWRPSLPAATPGSFTMADLLRFVNDVNPLG